MADPITVIGATASVIGILDVLSKVITRTWDLRSQINDANTVYIHLTSQLTLLRSTLVMVKEWMETESDQVHYQLQMDMDAILTCCKHTIEKLDSHLDIARLTRNPGGQLGPIGRLRIAFASRSIEVMQKMIDRQTSVLTLLLTTCNSKSLSQQKQLLEDANTRKIVQEVQRESASLIVLRDTSSFRSYFTDSLSKLSLVFDFDPELFHSRVYDRFLRGNTKQLFRSSSTQIPMTNILLLGPSGSSKTTLFKQIQAIWSEDGHICPDYLKDTWVAIIHNNIIATIAALYYEIREISQDLDSRDRDLLDLRFERELPEKAVPIIKRLSHRVEWQIMVSKAIAMGVDGAYFLADLERILTPGYTPTDQDLLRAKVRTTGKTECQFKVGDRQFSVTDVGGRQSEQREWVHAYKGQHAVLFEAPIGSYNEYYLLEDLTGNQMVEALRLWNNLINLSTLSNAVFFLNFTRADVFKRKMSGGLSDLSIYFPTYTGGSTDVDAGQRFFEDEFRSSQRSRRSVHVNFIDATDRNHVETLLEQVVKHVR